MLIFWDGCLFFLCHSEGACRSAVSLVCRVGIHAADLHFDSSTSFAVALGFQLVYQTVSPSGGDVVEYLQPSVEYHLVLNAAAMSANSVCGLRDLLLFVSKNTWERLALRLFVLYNPLLLSEASFTVPPLQLTLVSAWGNYPLFVNLIKFFTQTCKQPEIEKCNFQLRHLLTLRNIHPVYHGNMIFFFLPFYCSVCVVVQDLDHSKSIVAFVLKVNIPRFIRIFTVFASLQKRKRKKKTEESRQVFCWLCHNS